MKSDKAYISIDMSGDVGGDVKTPGYGRYGWSGYCGCPCGGPWARPASKDEIVDELEDYKASLESEIAALEKRIKTLREKKE